MGNMSEKILTIFVLIGTIPAAISGAMLGIRKRIDLLGVCVLGITTGVGGGIIRDLILGNTPPQAFRNPIFALTAFGTAVLTFLPPVHRLFERQPKIYTMLMLVTDSIGLGVFTVAGVQTAKDFYPGSGLFLLIFVGTVTGVGGGVLRDLLAAEEPYILAKRHLYAGACILGALLCALLWDPLGKIWSMSISAAFIFIFRLLSAHYHWKMPQAAD